MNRYSNSFGFYEITNFPGCNQLAVSNHAFILPQFRGDGHGQAQHQERLGRLKDLHYNYVVCTVRANNAVERHILEKNGWKHLDCFENTESNHLVCIYGRHL